LYRCAIGKGTIPPPASSPSSSVARGDGIERDTPADMRWSPPVCRSPEWSRLHTRRGWTRHRRQKEWPTAMAGGETLAGEDDRGAGFPERSAMCKGVAGQRFRKCRRCAGELLGTEQICGHCERAGTWGLSTSVPAGSKNRTRVQQIEKTWHSRPPASRMQSQAAEILMPAS
jgi:hypothetical protein